MHLRTKSSPFLAAAVLALATVGQACPGRDLGPVRPVVQSGTKIIITQPESSAVDLLVMVDNSNSMAQEQAHLTDEFEILLDTLTSPPVDRPEDGPLVTDLHVGVISTDMGTGGFAVQTCEDSIDGDDGILRSTPSGAVAGCGDDYPEFLSFGEGGDASALNRDFSCLATLGTGGCGFEQQLQSVRKALTTHAAGANAGFLRENSLLAILMVTDEEDCSVRDAPSATDIFNTQLALGPLNLRCYNHRDQYVEPVDTFVQDILALRPDNPDRLVVAAIVGIPPTGRNPCNLTGMGEADFQCLLDLPDMQEVIDNSAEGRGERLTPSCDDVGLGEAFPPRRIVEFVRGISAGGTNNGIVRSICDNDFRPAMEAITDLIATKIQDACLARALEVHDSGQVDCIIQEQMVTSDPCGPGRIDLGPDGHGGRICQICQEGDGLPGRLVDELNTDLSPCAPFNETGDFWRYLTPDEADECEGRGKVEFAGDSVPLPGSTASLECLSKVGR